MTGRRENDIVKWNCDPDAGATLTFVPSESASSSAAPAHPPTLSMWSLQETAGLPEVEGETVGTFCAPSAPAPVETSPPQAPMYCLRAMLGRGGMGEVWEAWQTSLARTVAVKRIRQDRLARGEMEGAIVEFRREAMTSALLEHPNIVPVHDFGIGADGSPLLAMKLVKGSAWDDLLEEELGAMPWEEYLVRHVGILISVTQAVAFAHSRGIIHRDLKPAQVMVGEFGEVLLMDWGLAISIYEATERQGAESPAIALPTQRTASSPSGTPALMAPEQTLITAEKVGRWTDVYLLGGTLYHILTSTYPHEAKTAQAAMALAAKGVVSDPRRRAPQRAIPEDLADLCMRALAFDPGMRPSSAMEFLRGLQDHLGGAGKRRESAAITERLDNQGSLAKADYEEYSGQLADLAQAETLWSANPRISPLRDAILEAFASVATAAGDLKLARVQARRIDSPPPRERLLARIECEESRLRMQSRTRRAAIWAVINLLLVGIAGAIIFNSRVTKERNAALLAEKMATAARGEAESMVNYMMNDLAQQLEPIGKLNLMEGVSDQVIKYGERSDREAASVFGILGQAQAYRLRAHTVFDRGDFRGALEEFDHSEKLARMAVQKWPADKAPKMLLLRILDQSAGVRLQSGDLAGAQATIERQIDAATKLMDAAPEDSEVVLWKGRSLERMARIHQAQENWDEARRFFEQAGHHFDEVLPRFPNDVFLWRTAKGCYQQLGSFESDRKNIEPANIAFAKARAIAEKSYMADSTNTQEIESLALLDNLEANHLRSIEQFDEALKLDAAYVSAMRRLVDIEPANMRWRYQLAVGESNYGYNQMQKGEFDAALEAFEQYVSTMEALCADHPGNGSWEMELSDGRYNIADAWHGMGKLDEGIQAGMNALAGTGVCLDASPGDPRLLSTLVFQTFRISDWMWEAKRTDDKLLYETCLKYIEAAGEAGRDGRFQSARGELLYRLGRMDEAREAARAVLATGYRDPSFDGLCGRLGIPLPEATPAANE